MQRDIAYFISWCIEEYKSFIGADGASTMRLLDKYGVLDYLASNYEVLHTQSRQWLMEEISDLVDKSKKDQ